MADFHITGDTKLDGSGFQSGLSAMTVAAGNLIGKLVSEIASAATNAAKSVISTGMPFDTTMSQVAATMGKTVDEIQDISDKAKEMGATTKFTATEAAQGMNILAMAGLDAAEQIAGIDTVLSLASAGVMSLESAASYVTGTVKGFSDSMNNARYYADLMAKGATMANTDVAGLGDAMSTAAATAAGYKQSAEGTALALLRLAEQNETGSEAATAMNRAMMDLYTPTEDAATALKALGVSAYDSSGNARDFNTVVDELSAALSGMSDEEANAYKNTIFTTYGLNAFNKMTVSSEETVKKFKDGLAGASAEFDGAGAAAGQAATQIDNLEGDMTLLSSATDGLSLALYNTFSDAARSVVRSGTAMITDLTTALESDGIPGMLLAAQGMASSLIQGLVDNIIDQGPSIISAGAKIVTNAMTGIVSELPNILATGVTLVSTLVSAFASELPGLVQAGASMISSFIQGAGAVLPKILNTGIELVGTLVSAILGEVPGLLQTGVDTAVQLIAGLSSGLAQAVPEFLGQALPMLMEFTGQLRENAGQLVDAGINLILQLGQGIADSIPTLVETIPTIVSNIAGIINDNAPKLLSCGIQLLATLAKGLIDAIPTIVANIPQIIQAIVDVFTAFNWVNFGSQLITNIGNGIKGMASFASSSMSNIRNAIVKAIQNLPSTLMNLGRNIIQFLSSGISRMLGTVAGAIGTIAGTIVNAIMALPSQVLGLGKNIIQGLIDGIASLGTGVVDAVIEIGNNILNGFRSLFGIHSPSTVMADMGGYLVDGLLNGLSGAWDSISSFFSDAWSSIQDTVSGAWDSIQETASTAWNAVTGTVSTAASGIYNTAKDKFTSASSTIAKQVTGAKTVISSGFDKAKSSVTTAASNIYKTVSSKFSSARSTVSTAAGNIYTSINSKFNSAKSAVATAAGNIYTSISSKFTSAKTPVANAVGSIYTTASGKFANVKTSIANAVSSIYSTVASKFSSMKSSMSSTFSQLKSSATAWGKDICSNLSSGIRSAMSRVTSAASSVASKIRSYLHFSEPDIGPLSDFHTYMPDMLELMAKGIRDNADVALSEVSALTGDMADRMRLDTAGQSAGTMVGAAQANAEDLVMAAQSAIIEHQIQVGSTMAATGSTTQYMATYINNTAQAPQNTKLDAILQRLDQYLPQLADTPIYLDTGQLVGGTVRLMDKALTLRAKRAERSG